MRCPSVILGRKRGDVKTVFIHGRSCEMMVKVHESRSTTGNDYFVGDPYFVIVRLS